MRKYICGILSLALCAATLLGGCSFVNLGDKSSASESKQETATPGDPIESTEGGNSNTDSDGAETSEEGETVTLVYDAELCEYFDGMANGNAIYINTKATVKTTNLLDGTVIGTADAGEIIIDGGANGAILTATGSGVGSIQPAEGATLVFKNLTIRDSSLVTASTQDRREGYLEFGGKLRFENCQFACAAYFCDDADAEFIDCEFNSGAQNMYAVWVSDGSVSFKNCTFEGWRAIKLYEGSDNKYTSVQDHFDVVSVVVDGCLFQGLQKKPGIAIDVFQGKETSIIIKNSEFYDCKDWTIDSYEGLLTVYESRVDTSTLTFVMENVTSDGNTVNWSMDREFGTGQPNA